MPQKSTSLHRAAQSRSELAFKSPCSLQHWILNRKSNRPQITTAAQNRTCTQNILSIAADTQPQSSRTSRHLGSSANKKKRTRIRHTDPQANVPVLLGECLRRGRSAASYPGALGGAYVGFSRVYGLGRSVSRILAFWGQSVLDPGQAVPRCLLSHRSWDNNRRTDSVRFRPSAVGVRGGDRVGAAYPDALMMSCGVVFASRPRNSEAISCDYCRNTGC